MTKQDIINAYCKIRTIDNTIPDEVLNFMQQAAIEKLEIKNPAELLEACKWARDQFKKLSDQGKYPEFMLAQNGGEGIMPLVNAINNATT